MLYVFSSASAFDVPKLAFLFEKKTTLFSFHSYIGRPTAASPATGSKVQHLREQSNLLEDGMAL